jgi:Zn-dependent M28 family amino/carboxypeptidase
MAVDPGHLRTTVEWVARERSPLTSYRGLEEVGVTIEQTLRGLGYAVTSDPFQWEGKVYQNLVAERPPQESPVFIVGAHYDAVPNSPGADDNASGIAVLLEVARVFQSHPVARKVRFVAFTLEESGMMGSSHYVEGLQRAGENLLGMISLEMVGFTSPKQSYPVGLAPFYPAEGNFIGIGANGRSRSLMKRFVKGMRHVSGLHVETITLPGNGSLIPAIRLSDHAPFWDAGYPALLVTETAFYRNPHYHLETDTIDTLDFCFLSSVTQGVVQGILEGLE